LKTAFATCGFRRVDLMATSSSETLGPGDGLDSVLAQALRSADTAMFVADVRAPDHPIVFVNDAFAALTGYGCDELLGRGCWRLQGPDTDPDQLARLQAAGAAGECLALEILNYRKDGEAFWNAVSLSPVRGPGGEAAYMLAVQHDVTGRKTAELGLEGVIAERTTAMDAALKEKSALLHEVDHRVKNNLQLISSLLLLQSRRVEDERVRRALRAMLERVSAVATVHRRLFQSHDIERFDVADFIRDLASDLAAAAHRPEITFRLDLERVEIAASQAAPAALVINELIGNALKHAFPEGRAGTVEVRLRRTADGLDLSVQDDGVGFSGPEDAARDFGLTIAHLLCRQLHATLSFEAMQPGVRALVKLVRSG
jgi:PAS domain S-box-containing protein